MNVISVQKTGIVAQTQSNISAAETALQEQKSSLKNVSGQDKIALEATIAANEKQITTNHQIIAAYKSKSWKILYPLLESQAKSFLASNTDGSLPPEEVEALDHDVLMFQALEKKNFPYQDPALPTSGLNFMVSMMQYVVPLLLVLSLLFILSQLYSASFKEGINLSLLYPKSQLHYYLTSIISGTIVSVCLLMGAALFSFILAGITNGVGHLDYPVLFINLETKAMHFQEVGSLIFPSLVIFGLYILFLVSFMFLICYLTRERFASLFLGLLGLVGLDLATNQIVPLQKIAQYLPTSYLNAVSIVTGEYAKNINNYQVSFLSGVICLGFSIVIIVSITILVLSKNLQSNR
jgi:hypothetical protein